MAAATWPVEEFRAYLRALMDAADIPDYAELSRLTGVNQSVFSNWRRGVAQPDHRSLNRIAPILEVVPVKLWLAAGLVGPEDLDLADTPDLRVLPPEFRDLLDLLEEPGLGNDERVYLRRSIATLVAGVRAELASRQGRPNVRRKAG